MSLQVWLPLNGNLQNKGLENIGITNNGAVVDTTGKIGKCYSFDGTDDYLSLSNITCAGWAEFSLTCWCYPTADFGALFLIRGSGAHRIRITGSGFAFRDNNNSTLRSFNFNTTIPLNTWTHLACIYNRGKIFIYINGVLTNSNTSYYHDNSVFLSDQDEVRIARQTSTSGSVYYTGKINDFRIYNHALSQKEVKEIYKTLVLHYPLDDTFVEPTTNLCDKLISGGRTVVTDDTVTNTGVNADTYWYIKPKEATIGGETYTLSCYLTGFSSDSTYISWGVCAQSGTGSAGSWKCYNGYNTFTFTMPASRDGSTANIIFDDNGGTRTEIFTISQVQLEKKDHATGYAGIGGVRNNTIIYDCSGYQNNGTIVNLSCSSDTIKYQGSTSFDGDTSVIQLGNISSLLQNEFTMNLWFKKSELGSKTYETLFGGPSGFEMDTRSGSSSTLSLYMASTRGGNAFSPFNFNQWYMVTMVRDSTNQYYYINGELKKTIQRKSMPNGNYFIGSWSTAIKQNYKGLISDFRLYVTALPAQDILQLYKIRADIDRNKIFHAEGEFIEEGYNNQIEYFYDFKKSSGAGTITHQRDGLYLDQNVFVNHGSSEYISINPQGKTYKYEIVCSIDAGNQFYIGWERYDADKTARSNNACVYAIATKPSTNITYQRYAGTINLSTDGVNPCAFIRLRILNKWTGSASDTNGTAIIHSLSLKEYSTSDVFPHVNVTRTGLTKSTEILQINNIDKVNINRTQQINANAFIEN